MDVTSISATYIGQGPTSFLRLIAADMPSTGLSQSDYAVPRSDEHALKKEREGNVAPGSLPEYIGSETGVFPDGNPSSEHWPSSDESLECLDALLTQFQRTEQRLFQENRELRATNDSLRQQLRFERQRKNQIALQSDLEKERNLHDKAKTKEAHDQEITEKEAAYSTLQSAHNAEVEMSRRLRTELDAERLRYETFRATQQRKIDNLTAQNQNLQRSESDKQNTIDRLTNDLATERRAVHELRRKLEEERRQTELSAKRLELQRIVGVPVSVRRVNSGGESSEEDLNRLTPLMRRHLKTAVEKFRTYRQVKRIEYIMNDRLYWQYNDAKCKFSSHARPTTEIILFHGTNGRNIDL